jgi:hypothetical protein
MDGNNHLLLVDDEALNRDMLSRRLAHHGFRVDVAADGPSALQSVAAHRPDLVLLDSHDAGHDGRGSIAGFARHLYPEPVAGNHGDRLEGERRRGGSPQPGRQRLHHQAGGFPGSHGAHSRSTGAQSRRRRSARERGTICAGGARRQRWYVGLGPGFRPRLLLRTLEGHARATRTAEIGEGIDEWFRACNPRIWKSCGRCCGRNRTSASGGAFECEHRMRHRDGTIAGCAAAARRYRMARPGRPHGRFDERRHRGQSLRYTHRIGQPGPVHGPSGAGIQ